MTIRILLADDHQIVRDGLRALLEKRPGMDVVGEARDGRSTVQLAKHLSPHLIIMDLTMPDLNGIEATHQIKADMPHTKIIALSMHSDRRYVTQVLKAGASGYLLKDCAFEELDNAIRTVMANQIYLSPQIAGVVIDSYLQDLPPADASAFSVLTAREREVLQLLAEGRSTKEIASHLHVSVKTVETHRRRIMEKLGLHSIAELTKYALREGLTSPEP